MVTLPLTSAAKLKAPAPTRVVIGLLALIARRLAFGALVLLSIIVLTYLGLDMAGGVRFGPAVSRALPRTLSYVGRLVQGDLGLTVAGSSTAVPRAVAEVVLERLPRSLALLTVSLCFAALLGTLLGVLAARGRSARSLGILLVTLVGVSIPSFLAAFLLQRALILYARAMGHSLLPAGGFGWDKRLILPALVLAARPFAQITRIAFISVRHVLEQDYVRTARGKGLREGRLLAVHVLRNAAIPILTTTAVSLRFSLSSLPVVELYFGWTGIGYLLLRSIARRDDNLTIALVLCLGVLFVLVNLALELIYHFIDPRLREASSSVVSEGNSLAELRKPSAVLCSILEALFDAVRNSALATWLQRRRTVAPARLSGIPISSPAPQAADSLRRDKTRPKSVPPATHVPWSKKPGWGEMRNNISLVTGGLLSLGLVAIVLFGPQWAPNSPSHTQGLTLVGGQFISPPFPPGGQYPWGTDALGRCIMSLVFAGARQTLVLALLAVAARVLAGVVLGTVAGWSDGSAVDRLILGTAEVIASFPTLLLTMILILALGIRRGMPPFVVALCFVGWGEITQFVRGQVMAIRSRPYVESAVAVGAHVPRILFRHILPHLFSELTSIVALEMGAVLMLLGELGFVSIFIGGGTLIAGTNSTVLYSDVPEWGTLLGNLRLLASSYPWTALYPMLAFALSILSFNLLGEGIRRLLEQHSLVLSRFMNRYTVAAVVVVVLGARWLNLQGGNMPFYQRQAAEFDGERALEHVAALAGPLLKGRALGTAGMDLTAEYIADQFEALGLQAAGQAGTFFQQRAHAFEHLEATPVLQIEGDDQPLVYSQDYAMFPVPYTSIGEADSPVRFVGLGRRGSVQTGVWRVAYPDLVRASFASEILLTFSAREAEVLSATPREALLVVADDPADLARRYTFGGRERSQMPPWIWISEEVAGRLLAGSGYTVAELREACAELGVERVLQVPLTARVHLEAQGKLEEKWPVRHVIGYVPGTHSFDECEDCLGKQAIVVMAQYDMPPLSPGEDGYTSRTAYPGANDNASGVAVMLEAIRVLQETQYQPYKTLLFVAYSGEGLEGGEYVQDPLASRFLQARTGMSALEQEAVVYLQGVGGGSGNRLEIGASGSLRLAKLFDQSARRMGVGTVRAREEVEMALIYEDTGLRQGGQEAPTIRLSWEGWEAYSHLPTDTLEAVSAGTLEKAGQSLALALMILGREREY